MICGGATSAGGANKQDPPENVVPPGRLLEEPFVLLRAAMCPLNNNFPECRPFHSPGGRELTRSEICDAIIINLLLVRSFILSLLCFTTRFFKSPCLDCPRLLWHEMNLIATMAYVHDVVVSRYAESEPKLKFNPSQI